MDGLRQWALCLIVSAAAVAIVTAITPRGSTDKTVRAVAGIFMVSAIFTPVADMTFDFALPDSQVYVSADSDLLADSVLDSCRDAVEKAVISCADELGITVENVLLEANINSDNCIIIHKITVAIHSENSVNTAELEEAFSSATGAPVEVKTE